MKTRDDFGERTKRILAMRVGYLCSNPICQGQTIGPQMNPDKALNVGSAAHITAAAPGGARYDSTLTPAERKSAENGIWLCAVCAKLVDNDPVRFPKALLLRWKADAESRALEKLPVPKHGYSYDKSEFEYEANSRFGFSFWRPRNWIKNESTNSDGAWFNHPTESLAEVRVWGGYAVISPNLEEWVAVELEFLERDKGFELVRRANAIGHIVDYYEIEKGGVQQVHGNIEGYRLEYKVEEAGFVLTVLRLFLQVGRTQFSIQCKAPSNVFCQYEAMFRLLLQTIRVLGATAAPYPRSVDHL